MIARAKVHWYKAPETKRMACGRRSSNVMFWTAVLSEITCKGCWRVFTEQARDAENAT